MPLPESAQNRARILVVFGPESAFFATIHFSSLIEFYGIPNFIQNIIDRSHFLNSVDYWLRQDSPFKKLEHCKDAVILSA
jgi:hypothetical protein